MYFLMLPTGIAISHFYRDLVIRLKIFNLKIHLQIIFVVVASIAKAIVFFLVALGLMRLLGLITELPDYVFVSEYISSLMVIFCLWNVIYFGFQYFQNYKRTEINALRYLASSRESELNHLKAQLNPHFIFNAMNSIRALIDESPANAKTAVTQLSNILRNTLMMDKSKEIVLKDELNLVKDYLNLEHIRYEERLCYEFKIADDVQNCLIPPFIIQSQVENAIKHGISKLPGKGLIIVEAFKAPENDLIIKVSNTGRLSSEKPLTGVGFKNSIHRLELLYAAAGKISIKEANDLVVVEIHIPLR